MSERLPVYIELPVDMVDAPCRAPLALDFHRPHGSHATAMQECVREIAAMIDAAQRPVILAGLDGRPDRGAHRGAGAAQLHG